MTPPRASAPASPVGHDPHVVGDVPRPDTETLDAASTAPAAASPLIEADLLVEDVSIDGMCGVY
jgi:mycofactocin precursor